VIFPDGCVDLVWRGDGLVVAGPATGPAAGAPVGAAVFGVRFRLGAAGSVLGRPASEVLDAAVPLDELWGRGVEERVAAGGLPALLDEVRARLAPADPLARAAALAMARPGARVDAVDLGVSERQLRRRFVDAVGYPPKTLARILRFQRFLALSAGETPPLAVSGEWGEGAAGARGETPPPAARGEGAAGARGGTPAAGGERPGAPGEGAAGARRGSGARADLARLAFDAGYADQAHLTREARRLSGRTPAELVASGATPAGERVRIVQEVVAPGAYRPA
jgi:AraC-like DNA-binding protein